MEDEDFIVTIDDLRSTGHCVAGIRSWFKTHGLDFKSLLIDGISAQTLADTDHLGAEAVKKIREKRNG